MADFNFSVFAEAATTHAAGAALAGVLDNALREAGQANRWDVTTGDLWCIVNPKDDIGRPQGWKLHLSATPASAETVLTRSLSTLLEGRSAFKFASTTPHVAHLNGRNTARGHSGKFITVYPETDQKAVRLAEALHQATVGLPGPRILSDRPYASDSLVHHRYGAFVEERRLGNDGLYAWVIFDPEGNPVEDRRVGSYLPPSWASCPFPAPRSVGAAGTKSGEGGVLIGDRFLAREAIRHTNKGGVYRTVDISDGGDAIVKEARPHVDVDETGSNVRMRSRNALGGPGGEVVIHRGPRREIARQQPPRAARPDLIQDRVDDLPTRVLERPPEPSSTPLGRQQRLHQRPLHIGQIRGVAPPTSMINHPIEHDHTEPDHQADTPRQINFPRHVLSKHEDVRKSASVASA